MWQRVFSMVRKEFAQLFHDWPILFILLWAFTGAIYVAGHAVKMEVSDYPVVVYDLSRDDTSRELLSHIRTPHFKIV
ncbi:MAG: ABC transporter permease, partial [Pseudomonadota bacterium]|nr:ABC transporter permease [Pseudomonadota bacterium]